MQEKQEFEFRDIYAHPVVVNTGKLTKGKGHRQLIKAFKKMKDEVPGAKLHLLGDGDMKGILLQLVDDLDLENDVFFGGGDENPYRYLAKVLSPYFRLNMRNTLMIYVIMACGYRCSRVIARRGRGDPDGGYGNSARNRN